MGPQEIDKAIRMMLIMGINKEFVLLVVLCSQLQMDFDKRYQIVESFAGLGRIARWAKAKGYRSAFYDIAYDTDGAMDINGDAGFAFLHYQARAVLKFEN